MQETPQNETKNDVSQTRKPTTRSYIIAAVIFVVGIMMLSTNQDKVTTDPQDTKTTTENTPQTDEATETTTSPLNTNDLVMGYGLDRFEDLEIAGRIINSTQGHPLSGEGSEVLMGNVVDAGENNEVFFATSLVNRQTGENFVGIYQYNTTTHNWKRLYKETLKIENDAVPSYRVLARTADHLVLLKDMKSDSTDPCGNFWTIDGTDNTFALMIIKNPYDAFQPFEPSDDLLTQTSEGKCKIELE